MHANLENTIKNLKKEAKDKKSLSNLVTFAFLFILSFGLFLFLLLPALEPLWEWNGVFSAGSASLLLSFTGIESSVSGNIITMAVGEAVVDFQISQICSGDVEIALLFGLMLASFDIGFWKRVLGWVAGSIIIVIINPLRIALTLWLTSTMGMENGEFIHSVVFRFFLFVLLIAIYFGWYSMSKREQGSGMERKGGSIVKKREEGRWWQNLLKREQGSGMERKGLKRGMNSKGLKRGMNSKGFYAVTPFLGVIIILTTIGMGVYVSNESSQIVELASAGTGQARLMFIGQCVKTDSGNIFLQNRFVSEAANFVENGIHDIDRNGDFNSNLAGDMGEVLKKPLKGAIGEEAAKLYASAYNKAGKAQCRSSLYSVSMGDYATVQKHPDGSVLAWASATGHAIACTDTETGNEIKIPLSGRKYKIDVRVALMESLARQVMEAVLSGMSLVKGSAVSNIWTKIDGYDMPVGEYAKENQEQVTSALVNNLNSAVAGNILMNLVIRSKDEKLAIEPGSLRIESTGGGRLGIGDFKVECVELQNTFTCIPMALEVELDDPCEEGVPYQFQVNVENKVEEVKVTVHNILETPDTEANRMLGEFIGSVLDNVFPDKPGCVKVTDKQRVCKAWEGKPSYIKLTGRLKETNKDYVADKESLTFAFKGDMLQVDTDNIKPGNLVCEEGLGKARLGNNVRQLLQGFEVEHKSEGRKFVLNEGKLKEALEKVKNSPVAKIYDEIGQPISVGSAGIPGIGSLPIPSLEGEGTELFSNFAGEVSSLCAKAKKEGNETAMESFCDSLSAVKGVENLVSSVEDGNLMGSLAALGGMGGEKYFNSVSSVVAAVKSKDANAVASSVSGMLGVLGKNDAADGISNSAAFVQGTQSLLNGLDSNNQEDVMSTVVSSLNSGAMLLGAAGNKNASDSLREGAAVLGTAGRMIEGIKQKDHAAILGAAAGAMQQGGLDDAVRAYSGGVELYRSIENRDAIGALSSLGSVYPPSAEASGLVRNTMGMVDTVNNFDSYLENCKSINVWNSMCLNQGYISAVCPKSIGGCTRTHATPSFNINDVCKDVLSTGDFETSCTCWYQCTTPNGVVPVSYPGRAAFRISRFTQAIK